MAKETSDRLGLLQGTLDMLIPRTLYSALHQLERKGWVVSKWKQLARAIGRVMWPAEERGATKFSRSAYWVGMVRADLPVRAGPPGPALLNQS